jgi:hypothetical protein
VVVVVVTERQYHRHWPVLSGCSRRWYWLNF